jgi:hypothetical protein
VRSGRDSPAIERSGDACARTGEHGQLLGCVRCGRGVRRRPGLERLGLVQGECVYEPRKLRLQPRREDELGDWTADLPPPPAVTWSRKGQLYGPPSWQRALRDKLEHHHGAGSVPRPPVYVAGPIASSDRLVKDPALLFPWLSTARNLPAVEMESGGVYRASRERCPMLAIRGVSDLIGLKRVETWTKFACASAAAFTRAFLRTRPISLGG